MLSWIKKLFFIELRNRYIPALTLIALISTLVYINVNEIMLSITNDGKLINVSGRQRMLSLKLVIEAKNYLQNPSETTKQNLQQTIKTMRDSHSLLIRLGLSEQLKKIYFEEKLDYQIQSYLNIFEQILEKQDKALLDKLLNESQNILVKLDRVVALYEKENNSKLKSLQDEEKFLYILILIILAIEVVFIFYPASKEIKKYQDNLENQIELKTKELQNSIDIINENVIYSRTDLKGKITYASKAFSKISGYSINELLEKPHNIVRHKDMPKSAFRDMWETIKAGEKWVGEVKNRKKDGGFYWVKAYIAPEYNLDGEIIGYAAVRHNITHKKKIEELNSTLEQKILEEVEKNRQKDQTIFEQNKRIQISEMISNIAHQWRQPLSIISTSASGMQLKKEHNLLSDEMFNEDTRRIIKYTQELSNTIDTFTSFVDSSNTIEIFKVEDLFLNIQTIVSKSLENKGIAFLLEIEDTGLELKSIKNDITTILLHLIYNSRDILKQRDVKNPFIKLSVIYSNEEYQISVEDNGGGIDEEIIGKIFDPYFTTKHQSMGTGMGLSICQFIVNHNLHGIISASNSSLGAKFTLTL